MKKIKDIGALVIYPIDGMNVTCKITDTKAAYGRTLYKLEPLTGSGHKWTSKKLKRVEENNDNRNHRICNATKHHNL